MCLRVTMIQLMLTEAIMNKNYGFLPPDYSNKRQQFHYNATASAMTARGVG